MAGLEGKIPIWNGWSFRGSEPTWAVAAKTLVGDIFSGIIIGYYRDLQGIIILDYTITQYIGDYHDVCLKSPWIFPKISPKIWRTGGGRVEDGKICRFPLDICDGDFSQKLMFPYVSFRRKPIHWQCGQIILWMLFLFSTGDDYYLDPKANYTWLGTKKKRCSVVSEFWNPFCLIVRYHPVLKFWYCCELGCDPSWDMSNFLNRSSPNGFFDLKIGCW